MSRIKENRDSAVITFASKDLPSNYSQLKTDLLKFIEDSIKKIELDFAKVKTLDVNTLVLLVSSQNSISAVNGKLSIVNCQDEVLNWLGVLNLIDYLNVKID